VEVALRRDIPVTPELVDGATLTRKDELPESLHPLVFKNAVTIRHGKDFKPDVLRLVEGLHKAAEWYRKRAEVPVPVPVVPTRKAGERMEIALPGGVPMGFAWCPPGTFLMGSPATESKRGNNEQSHEVRLTWGFWLEIHPVMEAQWQAVMGANPSHFKGERLPVENVSWDDAQAFCAKVTEKTGQAVRLPTEAQWEYAARGGTTTPFYWGSELNGTQANCDGSSSLREGGGGTVLGDDISSGQLRGKVSASVGIDGCYRERVGVVCGLAR